MTDSSMSVNDVSEVPNGVSSDRTPTELGDWFSGTFVSPSISTVRGPLVKEPKLNPEAKSFYPAYITPAMATAGVASVPSNSVPYAPHTRFAAVNGANGPPISQPVVGHMGGMTHPLSYASQFHTAVPVVDRQFGQLFFVQPVPHDLGQSTVLPPLASQQVHANTCPLFALPPLASQQLHANGLPLPPLAAQQVHANGSPLPPLASQQVHANVSPLPPLASQQVHANGSPLSGLPPLAAQQVQYHQHQGVHPFQVRPPPPPPIVGQHPPLAPIPLPRRPIHQNHGVPVPGPSVLPGAEPQ